MMNAARRTPILAATTKVRVSIGVYSGLFGEQGVLMERILYGVVEDLANGA